MLYWWTITPVTLAYDIERSVFESSRTKDISSIQFTVFKRPLNQIEQIKNIPKFWKKNWMLYFRKSSIEFGHQTEWSSLQKNKNGTKSSRSSVETAKAIWSFVSFITVKPVCNGPVLSSHPLLSGQFSKSGFFACTNAVFVPCSPTLSFFVILPVLSGRQPSTETKPYILLCNF